MEEWKRAAKQLKEAAQDAGKATADGVHELKKSAVRNQGSVSSAGSAATSWFGKTIKKVGHVVSDASQEATSRVLDATKGKGVWGDMTAIATATLGTAVDMAGRGASKVGSVIDDASGGVGKAVGGAVAGSVSLASETIDSLAISEANLESVRSELAKHGEATIERSRVMDEKVAAAIRERRKGELLDLYVIGGVSLAEMLRVPERIPPQVLEAYATQFPRAAEEQSFVDHVNSLDAAQLPGLVSGIKGKLFELQFVDYLNEGNLPPGHSAELAESAGQAGWDIRILDDSGQVAELLQAKATASAGYVRDALQRYPDIEVVSTSEVYSQLAALGIAEQVRDGGVTVASLDATVLDAANIASSGIDVSDFLPSVVGLAVIGLSVFMDQSISLEQRATQFGERSGRASVSSLAGTAVMIATQTWWLGLLGGVGTHWLSTKGRGKREHYEALREVMADLWERDKRRDFRKPFVRNPWRKSTS